MIDPRGLEKPKILTTREKRTNFGYRAATQGRDSDRAFISGTGDYHASVDRAQLVKMSRQYDRDNSIYETMINRGVAGILGDNGFTPQARTGDADLNKHIEGLIAKWMVDPEVRGTMDFREMERIVLRDMWVAGNLGAVKVKGRKLQLVEDEAINGNRRNGSIKGKMKSGNSIEEGIEVNKARAPVAYFVEEENSPQGSSRRGRKYERVLAKNMIFVRGVTKRISQTRGLPVAESSFANIDHLDSILQSEALAWELLSRFAIAINKANAAQVGYDVSDDDTNAEAGDVSDRIVDIGDGTIFWGEDGETITGVNQNRPSDNFPEAVMMYLRILGMPLGLPLELLVMDFSKTNFSSARASLMQAYATFRRWQNTLIRQFHRKVYRWLVGSWVRTGDIVLKEGMTIDDVLRHEWVASPFPWIDPEKETSALGKQIDRGLVTHTAALKSQGKELDDHHEITGNEILKAIEARNKTAQAAGVDPQTIPWQLFSAHDMGKTESAFMADNAANNTKNQGVDDG